MVAPLRAIRPVRTSRYSHNRNKPWRIQPSYPGKTRGIFPGFIVHTKLCFSSPGASLYCRI